jgi:alcohol dehydrogenase
MKAVIFEDFGAPVKIANVPDPVPTDDGAVIKVMASGICRSDWHGWQGRDPDITELPHVPGHELAGVVEEVGKDVAGWRPGERITVPFVCACGTCPECKTGNHHICDNQSQPGFTHWGSFAEYVLIRNVDTNLIRLPEEIDFVTAASLGCRFSTSFRACSVQGEAAPGKWVAVHGCGGVGLSAVMISHALGANVIAIDIDDRKLNIAKTLGAEKIINAKDNSDIPGAIHDATERGAHISIDALGSVKTCTDSILCLRKRGRHIQVGLMVGDDYLPRLPMDRVIAKELEIYGSHGMQANKYDAMLKMISSGKLNPGLLVGKRIPLEEASRELELMNNFNAVGVTVIDRF